jgi:hypothetical protein
MIKVRSCSRYVDKILHLCSKRSLEVGVVGVESLEISKVIAYCEIHNRAESNSPGELG